MVTLLEPCVAGLGTGRGKVERGTERERGTEDGGRRTRDRGQVGTGDKGRGTAIRVKGQETRDRGRWTGRGPVTDGDIGMGTMTAVWGMGNGDKSRGEPEQSRTEDRRVRRIGWPE